jgi:hypothetical protein
MRAIFSILSLLIVIAIVGVLAKKQLSPVPVKPVSAEGIVLPSSEPGATPQQQSQQAQQQIKQAVENTLQQARPMPEDN